jgi:hypothetical protein
MYLLAALSALVGVGFVAERAAGAAGAFGLGALTLIVLLRGVRREQRSRVAALVAVAMAGEVLGSLFMHLYAYRGGGIPAFVPPGHGLLFVTGLRLAPCAALRGDGPARRRARAVRHGARHLALGAAARRSPATLAHARGPGTAVATAVAWMCSR